MLFPLCRDFIYAQRTGIKFQKELPIKVEKGILIDQENQSYEVTQPQDDIEGIATKFNAILNDKNEVIFQIKEVVVAGEVLPTNIQINMKLLKQGSQAVLYKSIKKKITKLKQVIERSGQKIHLDCKEEKKEIEEKQQPISQISNNEITYINRLDKLSNCISKKYVIEYFKKQKIQNEKFMNLLFPQMQVKKELFKFE